MRGNGLSLRSLLELVLATVLLMGWARVRGWPGDLLLGVSQDWVAWSLWCLVGFVAGRAVNRRADRPSRRPSLKSGLAAALMAIFLLYRLREKSCRLMVDHPRSRLDSLIRGIDAWLWSREATPYFWCRNCTHPPEAIVMGMSIALLMLVCGFLIGAMGPTRNRRPEHESAPETWEF